MFAFARDGGLPLSWLWRQVDRRTHTPLHAVCPSLLCITAGLNLPVWLTLASSVHAAANGVALCTAHQGWLAPALEAGPGIQHARRAWQRPWVQAWDEGVRRVAGRCGA